MNTALTVVALLVGLAFAVGGLLTLVVADRALAARERRQAFRERELAAVSEFVDARLRVRTGAGCGADCGADCGRRDGFGPGY